MSYLQPKPAALRNSYQTYLPSTAPPTQEKDYPYNRKVCLADCAIFRSAPGSRDDLNRCAEECRMMYPLWGSGATFPQVLQTRR